MHDFISIRCTIVCSLIISLRHVKSKAHIERFTPTVVYYACTQLYRLLSDTHDNPQEEAFDFDKRPEKNFRIVGPIPCPNL